jgi:hypothetical protein
MHQCIRNRDPEANLADRIAPEKISVVASNRHAARLEGFFDSHRLSNG